jgi:2',3'-cyclic-nucleotide 2'-phosphodiesterase
MKVVFFGDIVTKAGRKALVKYLPKIRQDYNPVLIIANGENASGGIGITPETAQELFTTGVDVITSGNHIWRHKEILNYLESNSDKIIRPLNYPNSDDYETPGSGYVKINKGGVDFLIINIMGRTFIDNLDCPFKAVDNLIKKEAHPGIVSIVDFHAETTSEKQAMGWFLAGRASAVLGTHTHVQTADERILPGGTAYITDVGMCGSMDTVIGVDKEIIIQRFITQRPVAFKFSEINIGLNGVVMDFDISTGQALSIERLFYRSQD